MHTGTSSASGAKGVHSLLKGAALIALIQTKQPLRLRLSVAAF